MIRAYVDLASQPARAVYMFLKYTKIPHEIVPIALRKGKLIIIFLMRYPYLYWKLCTMHTWHAVVTLMLYVVWRW